MFDPKTLMHMARIGAEHQLEWIKHHFPDLIPGPKRKYKKQRTEVEEPVLRAKHTREETPRAKKPLTLKQKRAKSKYMKNYWEKKKAEEQKKGV